MAFAVHGTAELAFTGAAAGLLIADNPVVGALVGSLVVAALIATLGARPRERDSAIGAILAFGMGIGILLLGFYQGFATAATNILFGNIFGVSGSQLLILLALGLIVAVVMGIWYRPLLFASIDPETAEARGVPVGRLGLLFLLVLALTVTGAAQVVGTLLVLSLAITPGAAAQRLAQVLGLDFFLVLVPLTVGLLLTERGDPPRGVQPGQNSSDAGRTSVPSGHFWNRIICFRFSRPQSRTVYVLAGATSCGAAG